MRAPPAPGFTVLVVDDDRDYGVLVDHAFARTAVAPVVQRADDGETAIAMLRAGCEAPTGRIDLVILDLGLPRMTGHDTLAAIKQDPALRHTPVVVVTSSTRTDDVSRAYDNGANAYVAKPGTFDQLTTMLDSMCLFWGRTVRLDPS
jgi:CheY-like chemotaxis protein